MLDFTTADLHVHSSFSDGACDIRTLLAKVAAAGVQTLSVTDHDTLEGTRRAGEMADQFGIRHIPGVEISAHVGEVEVHLLAYGIDLDHRGLNQILHDVRADRRRRAFEIAGRLGELGLPLPPAEVEKAAAAGSVGRPHIARLMVEMGYVGSMREAFEQYLADGGPAYVPKSRLPAAEVIRAVRGAGGASVVAHPGCLPDQTVVNTLISDGVDGLEYIHPAHDASMATSYYELAKAYRLLPTGGSDFHGHRDDEEQNLGRYVIPGRRAGHLLNYLDALHAPKHHDTCHKS